MTKEIRSAEREPTFTSMTSLAAFTSLLDLVPTTASTNVVNGVGEPIQSSSWSTSSAKKSCASRTTTTRRSTKKAGVLSAPITREMTDSTPALVTSLAVKSSRAKEGSSTSKRQQKT